MSIDSLIEKSLINPSRVFLIDGLGALISAFFLGIVLVKFQYLVGIPRPTLYVLAFLPCLFALYDFYCFFNIRTGHAQFLRIIAYVNIIYCCLSLTLAIYNYETITLLGCLYIIIEITIVVFLAFIELKTANTLNSRPTVE